MKKFIIAIVVLALMSFTMVASSAVLKSDFDIDATSDDGYTIELIYVSSAPKIR